MKKYFGMRVLMAIPTILGVFLAVFLIIRMVPGDPASVMLGKTATPEEISLFREQNGLDEPLMTQMVIAVKKFFTGDLGESLSSHKKVTELLKERLPEDLAAVPERLADLQADVQGVRWYAPFPLPRTRSE